MGLRQGQTLPGAAGFIFVLRYAGGIRKRHEEFQQGL
jgi:hypothetical protein